MRVDRITGHLVLAALVSVPAFAAGEDEPPKLLGRCSVEQLETEPYAAWYVEQRESYEPHARVLAGLRELDLRDVDLQIFFGTWCGDSKREVPRWVELTRAIGLPAERLALIAVDNADEAIKRSPGGEERGLEIYRVPTVIVRRGGRELSRVVEHPVESIERDLLAILGGGSYEPSYPSYPSVRRWLADGLLADPNVDPSGLAGGVRHLVSGESELAAAVGVLQSRGDVNEAAKLAAVNCAIHRDSARCRARLADALLAAGDPAGARAAAQRALRLNDDPERVAGIVELIERIVGEAAAED